LCTESIANVVRIVLTEDMYLYFGFVNEKIGKIANRFAYMYIWPTSDILSLSFSFTVQMIHLNVEYDYKCFFSSLHLHLHKGIWHLLKETAIYHCGSSNNSDTLTLKGALLYHQV